MFGWRKRIGYIAPTVMELVPYEFYSMAPKGIGLVGVTCSIENWGPAQYEAGLAQVENSAQYLASRGVDYIIHGGAPLVTNREPCFDLELVKKLEAQTGVPATTSIRAGIDSMQSMGLRRITVVTPYPEATNAKVLRFLTHYGFDIAHSVYLDIEFKKMQDVPEQEIYKRIVSAAKAAPDSEGLYIPCPQICVGDILDVAERDIGRPIIPAIASTFFVAFRHLGIRDKIEGHGQLLASLYADY